MSRNYRKQNHTKANSTARNSWKICTFCKHKFPSGEFAEQRYIRRRGVAEYIQGPRQRWHTVTFDRCRTCRRLPMGWWQGFNDKSPLFKGMQTPIRWTRQGLPWPP